MQAAPGFPVEALDEAEVAVAAILGDGFADHDLEVRLPPLALGTAGADIAAINPDDNRPLGQRQFSTVPRGALDEEGALLSQFPFHAGRDMVQVVAHRLGVERGADREDVLQHLHGDAE